MNPIFNRYLGASVLVPEHVFNYISGKRPELFGRYRQALISTIATPDTIKQDDERGSSLFEKWFDNIKGGKFIIAVVIQRSP